MKYTKNDLWITNKGKHKTILKVTKDSDSSLYGKVIESEEYELGDVNNNNKWHSDYFNLHKTKKELYDIY